MPEQLANEILTGDKCMFKQVSAAEIMNPVQLIQEHAGFIPIDVRPQADSHQVIWMDVGDYRFTKTKFEFAIQRLSTDPAKAETLSTNIELLATSSFLQDTLYPAGFIFHMSRCGSTLFAKALARTQQHGVIDEGTPLNDGVWHYLTGGWQAPVTYDEQSLTIYRNLILALGRRRTSEQQRYFVKFRSWNVLFIDFITQAFPDVPCLFIYRDPVEVLVSGQWKRVWTLDFKSQLAGAYMADKPQSVTQAMDDLNFLARIYARYFTQVLKNKTEKLCYLNYDQLTRANFPTILDHAFNYHPAADEIALMQAQFDYYSKDDNDSVRFISDKQAKQEGATEALRQVANQEIMTLYQQLERSDRNLANRLR